MAGLALGGAQLSRTAVHRRRPGRALLPPAAAWRAAGAVALAVLALVALAAAVTAAAFAAPAREALGFGFGGVPATLREATAILLHNARLMGAVAAAVLVVQAPRLEHADGRLGRAGALLRAVVDVALAAAVAANAIVVGVAVGAYGGRMVAAMLPHGPPELAAYALGLALYLRARVARLRVRDTLAIAAWSLGLLAASALLEAFVRH